MLYTSTWRRPISFEYPHTWKTFEKTSKDGETLKFTILDLIENRYEDMFKLLMEQYAQDEPWTVSTGLNNDSIGLGVLKDYLLKHWMPQNITVICVLNKEECEKQGINPKIVGFNLIGVRYATDECDNKKYFKSKEFKSFLEVSDCLIKRSPNIYDKYKVDKMMTSFGLCVDREYRFLGIAIEILKVRALLCKAFNVSVSVTLFSAKGSQKAAKSAGFQDESSISFEELSKATGINLQSNASDCKMMSLVLL